MVPPKRQNFLQEGHVPGFIHDVWGRQGERRNIPFNQASTHSPILILVKNAWALTPVSRCPRLTGRRPLSVARHPCRQPPDRLRVDAGKVRRRRQSLWRSIHAWKSAGRGGRCTAKVYVQGMQVKNQFFQISKSY